MRRTVSHGACIGMRWNASPGRRRAGPSAGHAGKSVSHQSSPRRGRAPSCPLLCERTCRPDPGLPPAGPPPMSASGASPPPVQAAALCCEALNILELVPTNGTPERRDAGTGSCTRASDQRVHTAVLGGCTTWASHLCPVRSCPPPYSCWLEA